MATLRTEAWLSGGLTPWAAVVALCLATLVPHTGWADDSLPAVPNDEKSFSFWKDVPSGYSLGIDSSSFRMPMNGEDLASNSIGTEGSGFRLGGTRPETFPGTESGFSFGDVIPGPTEKPAVLWGPPPVPPSQPVPLPTDVLRGVRNSDASYGKKFFRGTLIITGAELACAAALAVLPSQFTKWDDTALERGTSNFQRAWSSPPVWDSDVFFHNWMGHPYAGSFYYNMIRSQGGTAWQSVKFTVFQTLMWEYIVEAVAEQPSIQDLVTTPVLGSLLGELFHRWSVGILKKGQLNFGQKALVFFLNPSYVINNGYRPPE